MEEEKLVYCVYVLIQTCCTCTIHTKRQNDERERIMHDGRIINIIAKCITIFSFQHIYSVCDPN